MRRFLILFLFIALMAPVCFGADTEVQDLDAITSPAAADVLYIVDDPAGTPASKKITIGSILDVAISLDEVGQIEGDATLGTLTVSSVLDVDGIMNVTGISTMSNATITNDVTISNNLSVMNNFEVAGSMVLADGVIVSSDGKIATDLTNASICFTVDGANGLTSRDLFPVPCGGDDQYTYTFTWLRNSTDVDDTPFEILICPKDDNTTINDRHGVTMSNNLTGFYDELSMSGVVVKGPDEDIWINYDDSAEPGYIKHEWKGTKEIV